MVLLFILFGIFIMYVLSQTSVMDSYALVKSDQIRKNSITIKKIVVKKF